MSLLVPDIIFKRISCITPEFLKEHGIRALILDVDNTLTEHDSQELPADVAQWLERMRTAGVKMTIASNNTAARVEPFAKKLGLEYQAFCCKPAPFGLARACRVMHVRKNETALIGDQIYTDVLGANLSGVTSLMVVPMSEDFKAGIRFKRMLEKPVLSRYYKNGGTVRGAAEKE